MTRDHAGLQLLKLGPLSFREFVEITGWRTGRTARHVLDRLAGADLVRIVNHQRRRCYVATQTLDERDAGVRA
jgi:hypothetical protein